MPVSVFITFRNDNPKTVFNMLCGALGREPSAAELKAEVRRILAEAHAPRA